MMIVTKSWGHEVWVVNTELYCFKRLFVKRQERCSYHYHKDKDETFIVERGQFIFIVDEVEVTLSQGKTLRVRPGQRHRFICISTERGEDDGVLFEVSTHHEDSDSYREKEDDTI